MSSGVCTCTSVWRTTTLTMSPTPSTNSANSDSANEVDSANTMVAIPNNATARYILRPALRTSGQRASAIAISSAPTAGIARMMPSPHGPTWKISFA